MKMFKNNITTILMGITSVVAFSCTTDVDVMQLNEERYTASSEAGLLMIDQFGAQKADSLNFSKKGTTNVFLHLQKPMMAETSYTLSYDEAALTAYNASHGTKLKALPAELVEIPATATIAQGNVKSASIAVTYKTSATLDSLGTYALPITAMTEKTSDGKEANKASFVLLVKDLSKMPDCHKPTGIEIISCMEVNDCNPLNNLCFTLKRSGKLLIDQVILFSGNINYNVETGQVYVSNNENVQHLLDYKEKYLKPLQEKGIKVILGILGNHDRSGIANLTPKGAKLFAKDIKSVLDAYELDGVFFDDEYSNYDGSPGFEPYPSNGAAARLCYETKKAIGNKIVSVYAYGRTSSFNSVDGHKPGEFVDYALHDYLQSADLSSAYPGLSKQRMGLFSQEYNRNRFAQPSYLRRLRAGGYGCHMIFAMDPFRANFSYAQIPSMNSIAKELFDDELVYNGRPYRKDW